MRAGLARWRVLFNRGEYWAAHEALEPAWHRASGADREVLQGLIQAAAAFQKLVVQGNPAGAQVLLGWAMDRISTAPAGSWGLDLDPFRQSLASWKRHLGQDDISTAQGTLFGLPRVEYTRQGDAERLHVERIDLHLLDLGPARTVLVRLEAEGLAGWGECRLSWDAPGAWPALVTTLAPALLADPIAAPTEVMTLWSGLVADPRPAAGLEAALWDLWSRRHGWPIATALDLDPRPLQLFGRVESLTESRLELEAQRQIDAGYHHLLLEARPNADRHLLPPLTSHLSVPFALDLGASYRIADLEVLRVLDASGALFLYRPFPSGLRHSYSRLCRYLNTSVAAESSPNADQVTDALQAKSADAVAVDPGLSGVTEAMRILDVAATYRKPAWITSSAATSIGLALDAVVAMHEAASWPADLASARGEDGAPLAFPDPDGTWTPSPAADNLGIGVVPDPDWLSRFTVQHAHLAA